MRQKLLVKLVVTLLILSTLCLAQSQAPPTGFVPQIAMAAQQSNGLFAMLSMTSGGALTVTPSTGTLFQIGGFVPAYAPVAQDSAGAWHYLQVDASGALKVVGSGGSGTVSANNGTAGALAVYVSAGGSTTVSADQSLITNGLGTLDLGGPGTGNGTLQVSGTTSGQLNWGCNAATCTTWQTGSPINNTSNSGISIKHFNQVAANNFAGQCTMAAATTCTATVNLTYASPICFTNVASASPTTFQGSCALSGTTVTVTASASNSNTWNYIVMGNPN